MSLNKEFEKQGVFLFKYRGQLPVVVLFIALGIHAWGAYHSRGEVVLADSFIYQLCCLAVSLIGLFIRIYSVGFAHKHTSGRNTSKQIADHVNRTGMYSAVRHPLYVGNFLMWLGVGMLTANIWFVLFFVLSFWLFYERIIYAEESFLIRKFGEIYTDWSKKVPAFLPKLSTWHKSDGTFIWRRIIRQEKTGIAALFLTFMVFHQVSAYFKTGALDLTPSVWNIAFIISAIYIAVIKVMQKTTSILKEKVVVEEA